MDSTRDTALQNIGAALGRIANNEIAILNIQSYASAAWTPTLNFGGSASGLSIATASGHYVQLGNFFVCWFSLSITNKGSATGNASVGGLPATSNSGAANAGAGGTLTNYGSLASISSLPFLQVGTSSTSATIYQAGSAASVALTNGNFTSLASISGSVSFFI